MATFKVALGAARADGTRNVRIRMIHRRKVTYIPTTIYVEPRDVTRSGHLKDTPVADQVNRRYIVRLREIANAVDGAEFYDAEQLRDEIMKRFGMRGGFRLDFIAYGRKKADGMKPKTGEIYRTALNAFERYLKGSDIDINSVTSQVVARFRSYLETEPRYCGGIAGHLHRIGGAKGRSVSLYLSCLRRIHNLARAEFNDDDVGEPVIPRTPFKGGIIPPQPMTRHRDLTAQQVAEVCRYDGGGRRATLAADVFALSFMLIGMNTVDLYNARKSDYHDGVLTYSRQKTGDRRQDNAVISVRVEPDAAELFEKWKDNTKGVMLFRFHALYADSHGFNSAVNKGLKEAAKGRALPSDLQFYHARHSWATIARNDCGIEFDTVHEALNHARRGEDKVTDIYVRRDFSRIWDANRKVLDYVFGGPT